MECVRWTWGWRCGKVQNYILQGLKLLELQKITLNDILGHWNRLHACIEPTFAEDKLAFIRIGAIGVVTHNYCNKYVIATKLLIEKT